MARISPNSFFCILIISIFLSFIINQSTCEADDLLIKFEYKSMKEKIMHVRLYWHDILSGRASTSVQVVKPPTKMPNGFGVVNTIDNRLTIGPDLSSKVVGKAQGFYALASQEDVVLLMAMNFVFTDGKSNGSTITILGRNAIFNQVREMPIIGGSGLFRFARGYVEARTHTFDLKTGDATVGYNIYVILFF